MAPHCDTMDGPVVKACERALREGNVNLILPWVHAEGEEELKEAFSRALAVREGGGAAADLADMWFFETAVRIHRRGEGAPYEGLKPAGLDWGPVIPRAEKAVENGYADEAIAYVTAEVEKELRERFDRVLSHREYDENDVPAAREYVQAMLGFVLFSHHLYAFVKGGGGHGGESMEGHAG
ncbi:MAG: DUF6448 family protein [Actinomycetota bacterium]|nr:DUF6448 family protein [Actinomycetota bacterium]MDD5665861.1 DUF6448 family protein [Actinomycetota bacterium]